LTVLSVPNAAWEPISALERIAVSLAIDYVAQIDFYDPKQMSGASHVLSSTKQVSLPERGYCGFRFSFRGALHGSDLYCGQNYPVMFELESCAYDFQHSLRGLLYQSGYLSAHSRHDHYFSPDYDRRFGFHYGLHAAYDHFGAYDLFHACDHCFWHAHFRGTLSPSSGHSCPF
jgi:hypothetical protein